MTEIGAQPLAAGIEGKAGCLLLDRQKALNALSPELIDALTAQLGAWRDDAGVAHVVLEGAGDRAFCAGADVRAMYAHVVAGDFEAVSDYFAAEYALDLLLADYPKPTIAIVDGICFGGGMGLAVHSSQCIATDRASFSMPETLIGFFPDAGATCFLPALPGQLGLYLGLTGARLSGADAVHLGLATHYVAHNRLAEVRRVVVRNGVEGLAGLTEDLPPLTLAPELERIDALFAAPSVAGIFDKLEADGGEWAQATLIVLRQRSPSALERTFALLRTGGKSLAECLDRELREVRVSTAHPDFREGVRAALVDKDKSPRWKADA